MDEERGIGKDNQLPWRLSSDLKRFKTLTMGHHLIMGRRTFESIGRPLPGRQTIIVTRNPNYRAEGCQVVHSLDDALALAERQGDSEAFVIGGAEIFAQALPIADRMYLTRVHTIVEADTFFPEFEAGEWETRETSHHPQSKRDQVAHTFRVLVRKVKLRRTS